MEGAVHCSLSTALGGDSVSDSPCRAILPLRRDVLGIRRCLFRLFRGNTSGLLCTLVYTSPCHQISPNIKWVINYHSRWEFRGFLLLFVTCSFFQVLLIVSLLLLRLGFSWFLRGCGIGTLFPIVPYGIARSWLGKFFSFFLPNCESIGLFLNIRESS